MAHGLRLGRLELYLNFDRPVTEAERATIRPLIRDRARHVPVAYLTGEREFYSLAFHVEPGVLIPRPETEHLVEVVLPMLEGGDEVVFADVGTGSGCIAVTLLKHREGARGHAIDIAALPIEVAARNAERHGVRDRLTLHQGDALDPLVRTADWGRLDAVACNPPYILRDDPDVERGVREHEPAEALFVDGSDPLAVAAKVARQALEALRPGGLLAVEIGHTSAAAARSLLEDLGYGDVQLTPDLAKIDRIVSGRRLG